MLLFQGGMAGGSALWGAAASRFGTPLAMNLAAVGLVAGVLVLWRYRLTTGEGLNLSPSMHWPPHAVEDHPEVEHGPILIMVEYHIDPSRANDFARAMRPVRLSRLRDGAMRWGLFHVASDPSRYIETFLVGSWAEHLRQHERMTVADQTAEQLARSFHIGDKPPAVSHFVADPLAK
jgi:hypothetical protein